MEKEAFRFPLFVDLRGKTAVIAGGGPIGLRRAQVLLRFGARVVLLDPGCPCPPAGAVYLPRKYQTGDLEGAFLAVAATDSREVNRQIGRDANALGIFVSVADRREESSFYFPAVCEGEDLIAGLVSRGDAHGKTARTAKKIRSLLEE